MSEFQSVSEIFITNICTANQSLFVFVLQYCMFSNPKENKITICCNILFVVFPVVVFLVIREQRPLHTRCTFSKKDNGDVKSTLRQC